MSRSRAMGAYWAQPTAVTPNKVWIQKTDPPRLGELVRCELCPSRTPHGTGRIFKNYRGLFTGRACEPCRDFILQATDDEIKAQLVAGALTEDMK